MDYFSDQKRHIVTEEACVLSSSFCYCMNAQLFTALTYTTAQAAAAGQRGKGLLHNEGSCTLSSPSLHAAAQTASAAQQLHSMHEL